MGITKTAAALGFAAVLFTGTACTWDSAPAPPANPVPAPAPVVVPPPAEPGAGAPADNCGLDPVDMDAKTKAQCGLTDGAPASGGQSEESGSGSTQSNRTGGGSTDSDGDSTYQHYQDDTGYPYSEDQYEQLPGYLQCGTACGKEPISGEIQQQYGCEQGYITEGC